ncbi:hypothetical protein V1478_013729, partial [Vespula squamosa]
MYDHLNEYVSYVQAAHDFGYTLYTNVVSARKRYYTCIKNVTKFHLFLARPKLPAYSEMVTPHNSFF